MTPIRVHLKCDIWKCSNSIIIQDSYKYVCLMMLMMDRRTYRLDGKDIFTTIGFEISIRF